MKRGLFALLLLLCIATLVLQVTGGLTQGIYATHATANGHFLLFKGPQQIAASATAFIAWIIGLFLAAYYKQWRWFIVILLLSYVGAGIYAIRRLLSSPRHSMKQQNIAE